MLFGGIPLGKKLQSFSKRVMVDMSATLLHHGHVRLIKRAAQHGQVVIGLTADEEIRKKKGYAPELGFLQRKEILLSIRDVMEVVETPWLLTEEILDQHNIDLLVHGSDNSNPIREQRLLVLPRTPEVSSSQMRLSAQHSIVDIANRKLMLTPGPAAILHENIVGLKPVFGRGDAAYGHVHETVLSWVKKLSGQENVICAQGSATFALELAAQTFVSGKILLVSTGYYSDRLKMLMDGCGTVECVSWDKLGEFRGHYDWVVCVYTETSRAFKLDLPAVRAKAEELGARLFIDATASIGLEPDHELADLMAFSSCKGLGGLIGACFIAHRSGLEERETNSFIFNVNTYRNKMVTGPYHAISSLYEIIPIHERLVERIKNSKRIFMDAFKPFVPSNLHQPLLCTYVKGTVCPLDEDIVLYTPRSSLPGSIVCHLGEVHQEEVHIAKRIRVDSLDNS